MGKEEVKKVVDVSLFFEKNGVDVDGAFVETLGFLVLELELLLL